MTASDYRARLLEELKSAQGNVLLATPPGVGARAVLAEALSSWQVRGVVLVVVDRSELAMQWEHTFRDQGTMARRLSSSEALLQAKDGDFAPVLITTVQRLRGTVGQRFLASSEPSVVVADLPSPGSHTQQLITDLSRRARVILVADMPYASLWFEPDTVVHLGLSEVFAGSPAELVLRQISYREPESVKRLLEQGRDLLGRGRGAEHRSVQGLHAELLRLVTKGDAATSKRATRDEPPDFEVLEDAAEQLPTDEVWDLLDRLESVEEDPRLAALLGATRDAMTSAAPCVILVRTAAEAHQLAGELVSRELNALPLTPSATAGIRSEAAMNPQAHVVVATSSMLRALPTSTGSWLVLWSPVRTPDRAREVITWALLRRGTLVTLEPDSGEDGTFRVLEQVAFALNEEDEMVAVLQRGGA